MVNIILDLDETLIHTAKISNAFSKRLAESVDFWFKINDQYFWILKRPGLSVFIDFVYRHFTVGIWTAAERDYAREVCRNILTNDQISKTKFIYSRNFCYLDSNIQPINFTKPLEKIYQTHPTSHNQMNTIMIDNNSHVMRYNHHNGIHVPDFTGDPNDRTLYQLRNMMIQYYHNVPMHLPVWGLVDNVNRSITENHDLVVNGRRQRSPEKDIILNQRRAVGGGGSGAKRSLVIGGGGNRNPKSRISLNLNSVKVK